MPFSSYMRSEDKSIHHISEVELKEFQECDLPNMEKSYKTIKQHCEKEWKNSAMLLAHVAFIIYASAHVAYK